MRAHAAVFRGRVWRVGAVAGGSMQAVAVANVWLALVIAFLLPLITGLLTLSGAC